MATLVAARRLGRDAQRPARRQRQRAGAARSRSSTSCPVVAVSDAHSVMEVGVAYTALDGDPSTPAGLLAALANGVEIVPGRATYFVRLWTPVAKLVKRTRGNGRVRPDAGRRRARPTGGRDERSRRAGPSADGGWTGGPGSVRCDGDQPRPGRRPGTPRHRVRRPSSVAPVEPDERDHRRAGLARRGGCASRGRSSRSSSRWRSSRLLPVPQPRALAEVPGLILQANPVLVLLAFVVFYLGFPLRG